MGTDGRIAIQAFAFLEIVNGTTSSRSQRRIFTRVLIKLRRLKMAAGRKRNAMAKRQPDGSIRSYEDPAAASIARRIRDRLYSDAKHDWYGYPLGIMYALKTISLEEFTAGKAWAASKWRLSQMDGIMLPMCKAIDWNGQQGRRLLAEPSDDEIEALGRLKRKIAELDTVIAGTGPNARSIVARLCIGDEELSPAEQMVARRALGRLVEHRKSRS